MNFIQQHCREVDFFTSLKNVERWLEIDLKDFDWNISDIEGAWPELNDPSWITGIELSLKLKEFDYQFDWAVLSAFPKGTDPQLSECPYANGNEDFWNGSPGKQLEKSKFEIVCWDSSATLFIGLNEALANKLILNAPCISNLDQYNANRKC